MMKRVLSVILAFSLLCSLAAAELDIRAEGDSGVCGDEVVWTLDTSNGVLNITGSGCMNDYGSDTMPWYSQRASILSICIGDGIQSIGENAFNGCNNLVSVKMGNGVKSIGKSAFCDCGKAESIEISGTVTSIGNTAFYRCASLTSVTIPSGVTDIGSYAFRGCDSLTRVDIADLAAWCGIDFGDSTANPLYYAGNLYINGAPVTQLTIPDSVTSIGNYAFYGFTALTAITIPGSVKSIGTNAFNYCGHLSKVNIADLSAWCKIEFKGFQSNPLYFAKKLYINGTLANNISIPATVKSISPYAFCCCGSLTGVTLRSGLTCIGKYAFYCCSNLTGISVPDSVTSLDNYAFYNCGSLMSAKIGNGVTGIGAYAFSGCNKLTSLTIGSGVKTIDSYAFRNCAGIEDVTIPDGVTSIGAQAFGGCGGLTTVEIPESVTSIGNDAFKNCVSLTAIKCHKGSYAEAYAQSNGFKVKYISLIENIGDIDGDTDITAEDLELLTRYLAGWRNIVINSEKADINGDGKITSLDRAYLARYLAGWEGYSEYFG